MVCSICGKKQSSFISDFSLSDELNNYRICVSCDQKRRDLIYSVGYGNIEDFNAIRDFFLGCSCESPVKNYLDKLISKNKEQIEKEIKTRQQIESEKLEQIELNSKHYKEFMITSAYDFKGYEIKKYHGILSAEIVLGTGFLSELTANVADFLGTTSGLFAQKLDEAKNAVLNNIIDNAHNQGCNGIIALSFNYILFSGNMIGIVANGTGVTIVKSETDCLENLNVLEKLAILYERNAISQQEYLEKKKIILEKIK